MYFYYFYTKSPHSIVYTKDNARNRFHIIFKENLECLVFIFFFRPDHLPTDKSIEKSLLPMTGNMLMLLLNRIIKVTHVATVTITKTKQNKTKRNESKKRQKKQNKQNFIECVLGLRDRLLKSFRNVIDCNKKQTNKINNKTKRNKTKNSKYRF